MKKILTAVISAAMVVSASFAMLAVSMSASASPAFVGNSGRDGLICFFDDSDPYQGSGPATLVANDGGQLIITCNGFIDGDPPAYVVRYSEPGEFGLVCDIMITPGGRFSIFCKN